MNVVNCIRELARFFISIVSVFFFFWVFPPPPDGGGGMEDDGDDEGDDIRDLANAVHAPLS